MNHFSEVLTSKDLHKPMEYTDGDEKAIGYVGVNFKN